MMISMAVMSLYKHKKATLILTIYTRSPIGASLTTGTPSERTTDIPCTFDQHWGRYWIAQLSHGNLPEIYSPGGTISQAKEEMNKFVDAVQAAEVTGKGVEDQERKQWEEMTQLARILIDSGGEL